MRRNPLTIRLWLVVALLAAVSMCACTSTPQTPTITYNIHFETGAFRVADSLTVEPGQGGDDSSGQDGSAAGGTSLSPGNNIVIKGYGDQGNIFNIGTSTPTTATPTNTTTTDAAVDATVTP